MKIPPETALAAWAVSTAWLILFVILEHFDEEGPDLIDFVQWAAILVAAAFYPLFRKWFAAWLKRERDRGT